MTLVLSMTLYDCGGYYLCDDCYELSQKIIESFGRECYTAGLRRGAEIAKNNECDDNCLCSEAIIAEAEKEGKV